MVARVDVDVKRFQSQVRQTLRLFEAMYKDIEYLGRYYLDRIRYLTPRKTGQTADAWALKFTAFSNVGGEGLIWEIRNEGREEIVEYLEFGTKPHVIKPKDPGGVLAFEVDGEMIFAKQVFHPGTKPLAFVRMTQLDIDRSGDSLAKKMRAKIEMIWGA